MTSEQAMRILAPLILVISGCEVLSPSAPPLESPYANRQLLAVVPLRNESGSLEADGLRLADHLTRQLENAESRAAGRRPGAEINVLPVNRVLAAMAALEMDATDVPVTAGDIARLMRALNVDGLIVGTITAYDPYDPPTLGLAVELHVSEQMAARQGIDLRAMARAATADQAGIHPPLTPGSNPLTLVSRVYDAADPQTRALLDAYGRRRGATDRTVGTDRYRISMDLYTEFVTYAVSRRLLEQERARLAAAAEPAP